MSTDVLRVLVDDVRVFRDERPALLARTSAEALELLRTLEGRVVDELVAVGYPAGRSFVAGMWRHAW